VSLVAICQKHQIKASAMQADCMTKSIEHNARPCWVLSLMQDGVTLHHFRNQRRKATKKQRVASASWLAGSSACCQDAAYLDVSKTR